VKKVYLYTSPEGKAPFLDFLDSLDGKQQKKLSYALKCLVMNTGKMSEPQVKHFSIERYKQLFELREKAQVLLRVVFTLDKNDNLVLLEPFIKRHKRNTNQALEASLKMLTEIKRNPDALREYTLS
jgi:phage-related protein